MGSYYIKYFFHLYFWNRNEISFLVMCKTTPHESFWNLTPLVSYYKIWPFTMFFRKFQDVWWKNRSHTSHSSQETRVLRFDRLLPVNRSSGSWEKTFSQVSTLWLLDTIRIFKIGWTVFENIRCNCWLIKTYISPKCFSKLIYIKIQIIGYKLYVEFDFILVYLSIR